MASSCRRTVLLLALVALFASFTLASTAHAAEVGVVGDITWIESRADIDREVELAQAAGVRWMRTNVNWKGLEGDGKGRINQWLLDQYDYAIDKAHAAGIQVLMPISDGVPYWASGDPRKANGNYRDTYPPANMADYGDIVRFVVRHFSARGVHAYEIWNEPNLDRFWASGPDPAAYTEMLKHGYNAVKTADPGATVVLGGLSRNDFEYLEGIYRAGGGRYFDAAAVHPYTYGVEPEVTWNGVNQGEDPDRLSWNSFPALKEVKRTMDAHGDAHKKVWITEFGYSTTSGDGGVSASQQADYLKEAYRYVERLPWVHSLFWYAARNAPYDDNADSYESQFGLMSTDFRLKPSYHALKEYALENGRPSPGTSPPAGPATGVAGSGRSVAPPISKLRRPLITRTRGPHAAAESVRVAGVVPAPLTENAHVRLRLQRFSGKTKRWRRGRLVRVSVSGQRYKRVLRRGDLRPGRWRVRAVMFQRGAGRVVARSRFNAFRF